mmetsp:Transcript_113062/g.177877  ORF Transcript_113062/g.177877 Transcript_113062/m.177877 type:complete len:86 (-) Transcript_113062:2244-2501(-)
MLSSLVLDSVEGETNACHAAEGTVRGEDNKPQTRVQNVAREYTVAQESDNPLGGSFLRMGEQHIEMLCACLAMVLEPSEREASFY